jgi:hypothetical protein
VGVPLLVKVLRPSFALMSTPGPSSTLSLYILCMCTCAFTFAAWRVRLVKCA